jgi:Glyoxalase/Bleomycin resistance protein/Dioxygenase superfamily
MSPREMTALDQRLYGQAWPEGDYRFFQLGFVVDDIVAVASRWAAVHGVGPFHIGPVIEMQTVVAGEPAPVSIQVGLAQAGPVQIELIQQHCDRPSVFREWTSPFHQLATITSDFDGRLHHLQQCGYDVVGEVTAGDLRVAYVDTTADFGFYTEVVSTNPGFIARWRQISETCATWDGSDPVRFATSDGYRVP